MEQYTLDGTTSIINSYYSDDITLTHDNTCSRHIWTSMLAQVITIFKVIVLVVVKVTTSFVGNDCYYESVCPTSPPVVGKFHPYDPLWDSHQCGYSIETVCCQCSGKPWFYKTFSYSTKDYIDVRICFDEVHLIKVVL